MPEKKVQCPHCTEIFKVDLPEAPPADLTRISRKELEDIIAKAGTPASLDHRHKTADEFLDCPECRLWFDKTALRYQVTEKEPPPPGDQPGEGEEKPGDKEPEPAAKPAVGSIFSTKTGGEHG
ncbi:unnamed protein product [marine sediment metagenome]|uniref:Uncharacterized protein n=1 Tax=marine sediment metagenome TaxID=412755 RepID=X1S1V8_9ZZZZ